MREGKEFNFFPSSNKTGVVYLNVYVYIHLTDSTLIFPLLPQLQQEKKGVAVQNISKHHVSICSVIAEDQYLCIR